MLGRQTLPFFFLSYFTETPKNTGMPHVNGPSTEPVHHASYNNAIQLDDDIASSSQASHNIEVADDQNTYDVIDDLLPGKNHNYDYVLQRQNADIEMSDIGSVSTKPVNHGSYNNAIQHYDELSGSSQACDNRSVKDDQAAYEVPVDTPSSDQNDNYIEVIPSQDDDIEMSSMHSPSSEPVDFESYNNKVQHHAEQAAYEVPVDTPRSGQNDNYIEVIPYEDQNVGISDTCSPCTEPVDDASYSNKTQLHNQPASSNETSDHNNQRPATGDQTAYEVPVDIFSSGQNDNYDDVIPRDEHYEKSTDETHYQPLEFNRETLYQELYEKTA